jgi:hypothetical protein
MFMRASERGLNNFFANQEEVLGIHGMLSVWM